MPKPKDSSDMDERFTRKREAHRREDALALASGEVTPEELQRKNSLIPEDFWSHAKIDLKRLSGGQ